MPIMTKTTVTIPASRLNKIADALEQLTQAFRDIAEGGKKLDIPIPDLTPPKRIPKDQEWFWSEKWQRGEREANTNLKAGRYKTFDSAEELIADLNS